MPRASFQQLPAERRAQIVSTAAEEFAAHGYQGTSYNQLLARLDIGKSSAYHYFEDKADLFRTAVAETYSKWFRRLVGIAHPKDREGFWLFIYEVNLHGFHFMLEDPTAAALMQCAVREASNFEQVLGDEQVLGAIDQYHRMLLTMGQQLGAIRTDLTMERLSLLSRAIGTAEDQAFVREVRREGTAAIVPRLPAIARQLTDTLRRMFEAPVPAEPPKSAPKPKNARKPAK